MRTVSARTLWGSQQAGGSEHVVGTLTDPATGEVLSVRRKMLGTLEITSVEEKIAFGAFSSTDPLKPVRGDLVVMPR